MKTLLVPLIPAVLFLSQATAFAQEGLTIYNQDFAIVRSPIPLDLQEGRNEITVTDVTRKLLTDSVILRDPAANVDFQILEQSYRNDPLNEHVLYEFFEGETIRFQVGRNDETGSSHYVSGKILRAPYDSTSQDPYRGIQRVTYPLIVEVEGEIRTVAPGTPLFPALPDDSLLKPTLRWDILSAGVANLQAELSYMTEGLSWKAAYNAVMEEEGEEMDFIGWITMDNQSGKTFNDASIKLMAGDVNRVQDDQQMREKFAAGFARSSAQAPPVTEESFDEYHLYTLENRTTLHDAEKKQVEFIRAEGVTAKQVFVYKGFGTPERQQHGRAWDHRNDPGYGTQSNTKVWIMREFVNSEENKMGMPLPGGILRFYRRDSNGLLQFIGENTIDHTPREETVRVYTGNAFDLVGERKQTNIEVETGRKMITEEFEITVRNRKEDGDVEIRVVEDLYRWFTWEITESSMDYEKTDAQTIEFRVPLAPDEEKKVTYTVRYTW